MVNTHYSVAFLMELSIFTVFTVATVISIPTNTRVVIDSIYTTAAIFTWWILTIIHVCNANILQHVYFCCFKNKSSQNHFQKQGFFVNSTVCKSISSHDLTFSSISIWLKIQNLIVSDIFPFQVIRICQLLLLCMQR